MRPLRDEGVLIIGSGFMTHGLPYLREFVLDAPPPDWSTDFDQWVAAALEARDVAALSAFRDVPSARYAHPTVEHFVPLFVALGAADPDGAGGHADRRLLARALEALGAVRLTGVRNRAAGAAHGARLCYPRAS